MRTLPPVVRFPARYDAFRLRPTPSNAAPHAMTLTQQRRVARECLGLSAGTAGAEWLELEARDHFFTPPFRELVELLDRSCDAADAAAAAGAGTTTDEG